MHANTQTRTLSGQRGVTLLEILIVLAVVAILAALAGPSFTGTIARTQVSNARDGLSAALQFARSEALKRKAPVSVCSSVDQAGCAGDTNWQTGWIVFADTDGDSALDGGELVLQVHYGATALTTYQAGGSVVTFNRIGQATAGPGNYAFCHPEQPTVGRVTTILVTGALQRSNETIGSC